MRLLCLLALVLAYSACDASTCSGAEEALGVTSNALRPYFSTLDRTTAPARAGAQVGVGEAKDIGFGAAKRLDVFGHYRIFDGSRSGSVDQLPLTFHWRLAVRPQGSAAMLGEPVGSTVSIVPDEPGEYQIELRVFDGELWSAPATRTMIALAQ